MAEDAPAIKLHKFHPPGKTGNDEVVFFLEVNGRNPAWTDFHDWQRSSKADFKKIVKIMILLLERGICQELFDLEYIARSHNPQHGEAYEMRAKAGNARLMFFMDNKKNRIVCTNGFWKGRHDQDKAFSLCAKFRYLYEANRNRIVLV